VFALIAVALYLRIVGNYEPHSFAYSFAAVVLVCLGVGRVLRRHPGYVAEYYNWLRATPWSGAQPLPLGQVRFELRDLPFVVFIMFLGWSVWMPATILALCIYLAGYLGMVSFAALQFGKHGYSYIIASAGALAFACSLHPLFALAVILLTLPIALQALVSMWHEFPWIPATSYTVDEDDDSIRGAVEPSFRERDELAAIAESLGGSWRTLRSVVAPAAFPGWAFAAIGSLAMWWQLAIEVVDAQSGGALRLEWFRFVYAGSAIVCFGAILRLASYTTRGAPPISLLGRILTLRFVVPRYDFMWLAPIAAMIIAASTWIADIPAWRVWATGLATAIVILGPPSMSTWVLTGRNRLK
jgi:hypothetical protein